MRSLIGSGFDSEVYRNYIVIMTAKLIAIGNSKGIRLPKAILEAAGLEDSVTLRVTEGGVVITPARKSRKPRQGWAKAFAKMRQEGDDKLLDDKDAHSISPAQAEEWQW
jgi:antitoxin MazE